MSDSVMEFRDYSTVVLIKSNASDEDVARSAWVSHLPGAHEKEADPGRIKGLIDFLWRNKHTSPFEHGQFTFVIRTPIFVAREFHRHRTFSYNEVSGRYSKLEPVFFYPKLARPVEQQGKVGAYTYTENSQLVNDAIDSIEQNSRDSWDRYEQLLEQGVAREVARMVLPVNLMTTFWATVNPLNLMRFLDLRTDDQALFEIREVAERMESYFRGVMPLTYEAWKKSHGTSR